MSSNKFNKRKPIRLIKRSEILNHFSMSEAIECMLTAFSSFSSGESYVPDRYIVSSQNDILTFLLKPAFQEKNENSCIKILTQKNRSTISGIPTILGLVLLIDNSTGEILSIMDGEYITAIRTGAASGLATKLLSRSDSTQMALFGCGSQGKTQLLAVNEVRDLERIWIFDRSRETAELFASEMREQVGAEIMIATDISILKDVDIICTATNSNEFLFDKKYIKKGTHINAIGSYKLIMQELDPELIRISKSYFDDQANCIKESGDYVKFANQFNKSDFMIGELGELILDRVTGRISHEEITIFKSVGNAIQDLVVANSIYKKSQKSQFGQEIRLYE